LAEGLHDPGVALWVIQDEHLLTLVEAEPGFGWTIVVDQQSGELTVTLTNRNGAYVLYGACTVL
jgi:hypothetical protein